MKSTRTLLLLGSLLALDVACTSSVDGAPDAIEHVQSQLAEEDARHIPAADFGPGLLAANLDEPDGVAGCAQDQVADDVEPQARARAPGVEDPRYRVNEDQMQASREADVRVPSIAAAPRPASPKVLEAQAQYLAEVAGQTERDPASVRARARRKAEIMAGS